MKREKREKVCYILPVFDLGTDTHYYHLYEFIDEAAKQLDVFLIIENKVDDVSFFKNVKHIACQRTPVPFRIFENLFWILKARFLGYKKFYIHYSFLSAITSSVVARLSGGKTWYWSCGMMWLFPQDKWNQLLWKVTLHLVTHLVTGVKSLAEGYSKHYGISMQKIKIMPNWIRLERFRAVKDRITVLNEYDLAKEKKYVLFVHRLAPRKGAHYLVPTAQRFTKDTIFLVVGDGPYRETLEQEIQANNITNIKLLGKLGNAQVPELMQVADVFYMPSEEEGFPRVVIEAMASGLPYVASDIGGVKEISPAIEQPYIVPIGDIDCYSERIQAILEQGKNTFSPTLRREAEKYSQSNVIKKFVELFS